MCGVVHITLCSCCLACKQHYPVTLREGETFCCMKTNKNPQFDSGVFGRPLNISPGPISLRKIPFFAWPWWSSHPFLPSLGALLFLFYLTLVLFSPCSAHAGFWGRVSAELCCWDFFPLSICRELLPRKQWWRHSKRQDALEILLQYCLFWAWKSALQEH